MRTKKDKEMPPEVQIFRTKSEEETFSLGKDLSRELKPGDTISLEGDLGTGKTALTKGIAAGLGIDAFITSPTFTLVNTYMGKIVLNHFDVYRIDDPEELLAIGWEDYFTGEEINVVEWGDKVREILPPDTVRIRLERDSSDPDGRLICIERKKT
jgi:tRNA threonylcarbamoyladenosine biosynthesis protein TsaE